MKKTVSIGIPAYNEEANIQLLLKSLLAQKFESRIKLLEIIVISDGSDDRSVEFAKSLRHPLIKVIESENRLGQQVRQNQMISLFKGDILVIIEADTLPSSDKTIDELIRPFKNKHNQNLGMVVGQSVALKPKTFLETAMFQGYKIKKDVFVKWKNGVNIYTSNGQSMKAISRQFLQGFRWVTNAPEDAYLYLKLKTAGFKIVRQAKAVSFMRNVTNLSDRIKQRAKYESGKKALRKYFDAKLIRSEYQIPLGLILSSLLKASINNPFWTLAYLLQLALFWILTIRSNRYSLLFLQYPSTKTLITKERLLL